MNRYLIIFLLVTHSLSNSLNLEVHLPISSPIMSELRIVNAHPMTTRSKTSAYKRRLLVATLSLYSYMHEPRNYKEGLKHPKWKLVMQKELNALNVNNTLDLITLLASHMIMTCKWVCQISC